MAVQQTEAPEFEIEDGHELDIFISGAFRRDVKRSSSIYVVDPDRVVVDLHEALSIKLHRDVTIFPSYSPEAASIDLAAKLGEARVFIALVNDEFPRSETCVEMAVLAGQLASSSGAPFIIALDISTQFEPRIDPSSIGEFLSLEADNFFRLSPSDPDAPLEAQRDEYRENFARAATRIEGLLAASRGSKPDEHAEPASSAVPTTDRPIWLVQYKASAARGFQDRLKPGLTDHWKIGNHDPEKIRDELEEGDWIAIWRTVEGRDRGGLIGWAQVTSKDRLAEGLVDFEVVDSFPNNPVGRDKILAELPRKPANWPGERSLVRLDSQEQQVFSSFIPSEGAQAERASTAREARRGRTETRFSSDRPETTRDLLRRGPLAFALAHKINDIWTAQKPGKDDPCAHERGAFILHIDAPWGGGKTTFANYVSRFLNPSAFKLEPFKLRNEPNSIFFGIDMGDAPEKGGGGPESKDWKKKYRDRKWVTVPFNAWQHQHVSPPWWDLYEVIRKHAVKSLPLWRRPYFHLVELTWRIFSKQVLWTLAALAVVALVVWGILQTPAVAGWFATDQNGKPLSSAPAIITAITGTTGLIALIQAWRTGFQKLVSSAGESTDTSALGTSDPLRRFRNHFSHTLGSIDRPVLVVIDDLDRCDPRYITELIRGMMTVFQSPHLVFMLLGDKGWIETAFAKVHADMLDAHDEEDVGFGARFVEKAIQMSFVLPQAASDERDLYVLRLLKRDPEGNAKSSSHTMSEAEQKAIAEAERIESRAMGTTNPEERRRIVDQSLEGLNEEEKKAVAQIYNSREAVKTAARETATEDIRHALEPLKSLLPANPRRIKRIINMITLYQASGQAAMGIDPGSRIWHQLVLWVVLMAEYPAHWRLLCADPTLVDKIACAKAPDRAKGKDPGAEESAKTLAKFAHPRVSALILGKPFREIAEDAAAENVDTGQLCALTTDMVEMFRRLTPVH